ncbi:hypothetical protein K7432_012048 [Basidiobolus ranarum]|uniref:Uncharacterized protein n=1 Tax=Basidiobolus ranarum TaxID=34480 RepID=A0ABR2WLI2_9FUNG
MMYSLFFAVSLLASAVSTAPIEVPCLPIGNATVEFFLDNKLAAIPENKCLFYTRRTAKNATSGLSKHAQEYAGQHDLTTIWSIWPSVEHPAQPGRLNEDFYSMNDEKGWLRCIQKSGQKDTYFSNMSEAYAKLCSGEGFVMTDDTSLLPNEGIWANTELPTLIASPKIRKVVAIDYYGDNRRVLHMKKGGDVANHARLVESKKLSKRQNSILAREHENQDWFG